MNWKHLLGIAGLLILGAVIQKATGVFSKIPGLSSFV